MGYDTPIPELVVSNAGMSALYYQLSTSNIYTSTFTLVQEQDVNITINVMNKCGVAPHHVSYLKIEEKINGV